MPLPPQLMLTSAWLKKSSLDDDDASELSSRTSNGDGDGSDDSDASHALRPHLSELAGVLEENEDGTAPKTTHVPLAKLAVLPAAPGKGGFSSAPNGAAGASLPPPNANPRDGPEAGAPDASGRGGLMRSGSFGRICRRGSGQAGVLSSATGASSYPDGSVSATPPAAVALRRSSSFGSPTARGATPPALAGTDSNGAAPPPPTAAASGLVRSRSFDRALASPAAHSAAAHSGGSMFAVPLDAMEEVMRIKLSMSIDAMQEVPEPDRTKRAVD